jgi:ABC-type transport system involved in multi-copper enzyme maturation permease subunit
MKQFNHLFLYEFKMAVRRPGLWISFGIVCAFFLLGLNTTSGEGLIDIFTGKDIWLEAAETVFTFHMFTPVLAGILASDRFQRDFSTNVRELQISSPVSTRAVILSKFLGVWTAVLITGLASTLVHGTVSIMMMGASPVFLLAETVVFFVMIAPAYAFVIAFSLGFPLLMPLRVYQILFTGYWMWGNLITWKLVPTISDTLLNASGMYALQGFYHSTRSPVSGAIHSGMEAWWNLLVIGLCVAVALWGTRYVAERRIKNA